MARTAKATRSQATARSRWRIQSSSRISVSALAILLLAPYSPNRLLKDLSESFDGAQDERIKG
jgi:hypothetical protein